MNQAIQTPSSPAKSGLSDPGVLLSKSWAIYKSLWGKLLLLAALPYLSLIPLIIVVAIFGVLGFLSYSAHNYTMLILLGTIGIILAVAYLSITFSIGGVALIYLISERDQKMTIKYVLSQGWQKLWSYWALSFLLGLILMGAYLFFIIPGFIFSVWFAFAAYILIVENKSGIDALIQSREYVRGYWWGIAGRILLISVLTYVASYVPVAIFNALHYQVAGSIIQYLVSLVMTPFTTLYLFLLYEDLKKNHPLTDSTVPSKRWLYIVIPVLGFIVLLVIIYFGVMIGASVLKNMPQNTPYKISPPAQYKQLPNFT